MRRLSDRPLVQAWQEMGLSAERLAQAVGCSKTHIWQIASGRRLPSAALMARLSAILGKSPEQLFPFLFAKTAAQGGDRRDHASA